MRRSVSLSFFLWMLWVGGSMLLPTFPLMPFAAAIPLLALSLWPAGRKRLKAVAYMMLPLGLGFWLIHGGVFASWVGGVAVPGRGLWALGLWLRILSVVSASQVWMEYVPAPVLVRELLSGSLPVSLAFLLAGPLLLAEQIKTRLSQIREAQLARGVPIRGSARERIASLGALLFPLILGLLNDLPARSAALDMKAFKLHPYRNSLHGNAKRERTAPDGDAGRQDAQPVVEVGGGLFFSPESAEPLLRIPDFRLDPGAWTLIQGGNGGGKSTLAMILSGGVPEHRPGRLEGDFFLSGVPVASRTSLRWSPHTQFVQQNPALCFSGCVATAGEEIAFGPENLALDRAEIRERVEESLSVAGVEHLRERPLVQLSGGEAQKVLLAAALAMRPRLLLLDEAFSRIGAGDVPVIAARMKEWGDKHGASVILLEREGFSLMPFCDNFARLENGKLLPGAAHTERTTAPRARRAVPAERASAPVKRVSTPALEIGEVDFSWSGSSSPLLEGLSESVAPGERVALVGANGAGKSTLLRLCGGLLSPTRGDIFLNGEAVSRMPPGRRASGIGFLFQDPERQIFHSSVEEEVLFSLRATGLSEDEKRARLEKALRLTGLESKEKTHPFDLNSAERRMVALASLSVQDLKLLLLDEPTRELDASWLDVFLHWMEAQDAAVLAITHDPDLAENRFDRIWLLEEGKINHR